MVNCFSVYLSSCLFIQKNLGIEGVKWVELKFENVEFFANYSDSSVDVFLQTTTNQE